MANEKRLIWDEDAKEMIVNHANEFSDVLNRREKALLIGGGTSCIDKCPTVDAVEVVHGRWERELVPIANMDIVRYRDTCSECGAKAEFLNRESHYNYCPYCGAKMDVERKDNG